MMQFFIAFFTSASALAQSFNYKIFTPADGLPQGIAGLLFQDSKGYLWVGSCSGLTRYDGKTFTNYGLKDGLPFLCNSMFCEDSDHNVWGASATVPIKFSDGKFTVFPFAASDSVSYINSLSITKDKKVRAFTTKGLFELHNGHWKKILLTNDPSQKIIRNVIPFKDDALLVNYYYSVLLKKKDGTEKIIADTSICDWYNTIIPYKNNILIAGRNKLLIYDGEGLHTIYDDVIKGHHMYASAADSKGRIWVSSARDGIMAFDRDTVLHFGLHHGLPHTLSIFFCEDYEGNMWLSNFKGLIRLRQSYVERFESEKGLTTSDVRSMFLDHEGNIFFGHPGDGFSYWNRHEIIPCSHLLPKKDQPKLKDIIVSFTEDEKGRIYYNTNGDRLLKYQNGKLDDITSILKINKEALYAVSFNKKDSSVYVQSDSAIFRIKNDTLAEKIYIIINNHVAEQSRIFFDSKNNLWMATATGELGIFDLKKKIFHNSLFDFSNAPVRQILEDREGYIWIATVGKGIFKVSLNNQKHITKIFSLSVEDGLQGDFVENIAIDSTGYLWALCSNGVIRFNLSRKNSDGHFFYQTFGVEDGITAKSFTDGNLLVDRNNNVWLSTSDGVFRFDSKKIYADTLPPKMQIEKIVLINDSSNWKNYAASFSNYFHLPVNPSLPFNKNNLTIYYNGIAFANNNEIEYAYKLDGLDTNWNANTTTTYASYINLSSGSYTFHVKARRKNYAWSEEETFSFTITPPFWETWWFRTITIIAASSLLIFAFRVRIKQIRRKASIQQQIQELEMKALKAQMNPHFIYNAMNSIQALVMNDQPEQAVRYIGKFAKLLRQVLNNSDKSLVPLDSELSSLKLYIELESLRLHLNFDYCIDINENIVQENEMVPPLVLQPYVENALWHGLSNKEGERKLHITINTEGEFLICEIRDNGIGRTKAAEIKSKNVAANTSKGLDITQRRLSLMNDENAAPVTIEDLFENGIASGTKVVLKIKRHFAV